MGKSRKRSSEPPPPSAPPPPPPYRPLPLLNQASAPPQENHLYPLLAELDENPFGQQARQPTFQPQQPQLPQQPTTTSQQQQHLPSYGFLPHVQEQHVHVHEQPQQPIKQVQDGSTHIAYEEAPDRLWLASLAAIICCTPIGILSVIAAAECRAARKYGDAAAATKKSAVARKRARAAAVVGGICWIAALALAVFASVYIVAMTKMSRGGGVGGGGGVRGDNIAADDDDEDY